MYRRRRQAYPIPQIVFILIEACLRCQVFAALMEIDIFLYDEAGKAFFLLEHTLPLKSNIITEMFTENIRLHDFSEAVISEGDYGKVGIPVLAEAGSIERGLFHQA